MLKIRLQRTGRRNNPYFRVILTDSKRGPKSGKYIEMLGSYDPKQGEISFKEDRVKYWMSVGAQASDTVHNFLVDKKIIKGQKVNVLPMKSPTKKRKELKGGETSATEGEAKDETKGKVKDKAKEASAEDEEPKEEEKETIAEGTKQEAEVKTEKKIEKQPEEVKSKEEE